MIPCEIICLLVRNLSHPSIIFERAFRKNAKKRESRFNLFWVQCVTWGVEKAPWGRKQPNFLAKSPKKVSFAGLKRPLSKFSSRLRVNKKNDFLNSHQDKKKISQLKFSKAVRCINRFIEANIFEPAVSVYPFHIVCQLGPN